MSDPDSCFNLIYILAACASSPECINFQISFIYIYFYIICNLTYRLEYQSLAKTLEEKEVLEVHAKVLAVLGERFGAKLR